MRSSNASVIRITSVDGKSNRFVAFLRSEFLDATYAVIFSTTITGAGRSPPLRTDDFRPPRQAGETPDWRRLFSGEKHPC